MESPSHHSTLEQQADALWNQFTPNDQDKFWKQYEGLLNKNKVTQKNAVRDQFLITSNAKAFRPSLFNYAQTAATLLFGTILFLSFGSGNGDDFFLIPAFIFLLVAFFETWKLNTFYVEENFLGVHNKFSFTKEYITWKDVDSLTICDRKNAPMNNTTYRELEVKTYAGKTHKFRFPMSNSNQREFISLLKTKNILITDESY